MLGMSPTRREVADGSLRVMVYMRPTYAPSSQVTAGGRPATGGAEARGGPGPPAHQLHSRDRPDQIVMPDTGFGRHGTLVCWTKRRGERVDAGELLATVEVDIADFELVAPTTGTLAELLAEPGETLAIGQPIATLAG